MCRKSMDHIYSSKPIELLREINKTYFWNAVMELASIEHRPIENKTAEKLR